MIIEIERNSNTDQECCVVYRESGAAREIHALEYRRGDERFWVQAVGWDAEQNQPCPAYVCPIADSGDGTALLIHGGSGGIRLKRLDDPSPWSSADPQQWGELYLVYPPTTQFKAVS
jgi:hypothetical protein